MWAEAMRSTVHVRLHQLARANRGSHDPLRTFDHFPGSKYLWRPRGGFNMKEKPSELGDHCNIFEDFALQQISLLRDFFASPSHR